MKRKVAQIGPSTLMVSLPTKWVKENGIKKGDELEVTLDKTNISYSLNEKKEVQKEIVLDVSKFNKYLLSRNLEMLYIQGYSKIALIYNNYKICDNKNNEELGIKGLIKDLNNRFIGMEIISQTNNSTHLKCFLFNEEKKLKIIEKRIFYLLKETIDEFLLSLDGGHKRFHEDVYNHHDNIIKFITYYLRMLESSNKSVEEKNQLYSMYLIIDKMVDKFRHINEMVYEHNCTTKVKNSLKEIFIFMEELFISLHKGKLNSELIDKRYNLIKKIKETEYSLEELKVINEARFFLDVINDFSRTIIVNNSFMIKDKY